MRFPRSSGILLHITSLPARLNKHGVEPDFGIGDLGKSSFAFVDFLKRSQQKIWQFLPVHPTGKSNSPYSCYSAFAGNQLLISVSILIEDGWMQKLTPADASDVICETTGENSKVDFENAKQAKAVFLRKAFEQSRERLRLNHGFKSFCDESAWWLDEFARFEALMLHFGDSNWTQWPDGLAQRTNEALSSWDKRLVDEIEYSKFIQFLFHIQWNRLKEYSNANGVRLYGDMPIFVAHESADVWANQELFDLDESGNATVVAGVPPDYFSETGQLWGNPLYRWDVMESNGYQWWTGRFRRALSQFDLLRVDHFRGFESYWEIPAEAETAISGNWKPGPMHKPFAAAEAALGELPIIAEDLGMITQQVHDLREQLGFPPMRVLQFGFSSIEDDFHRPSSYPQHSVAYTGTHDNDTLMGWYEERQGDELDKQESDLLESALDSTSDVHWQLIEMVMTSAADTVIVPLQDVLGLGNEARMNVPGVAKGNWSWRLKPNKLNSAIESRLQEMTNAANR